MFLENRFHVRDLQGRMHNGNEHQTTTGFCALTLACRYLATAETPVVFGDLEGQCEKLPKNLEFP